MHQTVSIVAFHACPTIIPCDMINNFFTKDLRPIRRSPTRCVDQSAMHDNSLGNSAGKAHQGWAIQVMIDIAGLDSVLLEHYQVQRLIVHTLRAHMLADAGHGRFWCPQQGSGQGSCYEPTQLCRLQNT